MNALPKFQDFVKHKLNDTAGTVIAVYPGSKIPDSNPDIADMIFFDVRTVNEEIVYGTPAANWKTVRTEEESW